MKLVAKESACQVLRLLKKVIVKKSGCYGKRFAKKDV